MSHTPGPWIAKLDQFDFTNEGERYVVFGDPSGDSYGRVALVAPTSARVARGKNKTPYNAPDAERDANARLIALAPAMLSALEQIRDECFSGNAYDLAVRVIGRHPKDKK